MDRTAILTVEMRHSNFLMARLTAGLLGLLILSSAALAQNTSESGNQTPFRIHVTHLLGFEKAHGNANGTLSIQNTALQFQKRDEAAAQIEIASIHDAFLGEQSKQVGGVPMTLGKAAVPFGGGRVVSLFAHKKYDTLTLEYVDANGGLHGAIFQLKKGEAEALRNELVARGAHVSPNEDKAQKPGTVEVTNERK